MGIVKTVLKVLLVFSTILIFADGMLIAFDKAVVELRVRDLRDDILDVASRNNGVPPEIAVVFEQKAQRIAERSNIVESISTNINSTVQGESQLYPTIGLTATSGSNVYETGDMLYSVISIDYAYQSVMFSVGEAWESNPDAVQTNALTKSSVFVYRTTSVIVDGKPALRYLK